MRQIDPKWIQLLINLKQETLRLPAGNQRSFELNSRQPHQAQDQLFLARVRMGQALNILDGIQAPGDIGSHLDLAIARLDGELGADAPYRVPAVDEASLAAKARPSAAEGGDWPSPWPIAPD